MANIQLHFHHPPVTVKFYDGSASEKLFALQALSQFMDIERIAKKVINQSNIDKTRKLSPQLCCNIYTVPKIGQSVAINGH